MLTPLPASARAHQDLLCAIFLALKDGTRRGIINPEKADEIINYASRHDCYVARTMLESLLTRLR